MAFYLFCYLLWFLDLFGVCPFGFHCCTLVILLIYIWACVRMRFLGFDFHFSVFPLLCSYSPPSVYFFPITSVSLALPCPQCFFPPSLHTCPVSVMSTLSCPQCPPGESTPTLPLSNHLFPTDLLVQLGFRSSPSTIWCRSFLTHFQNNCKMSPNFTTNNISIYYHLRCA